MGIQWNPRLYYLLHIHVTEPERGNAYLSTSAYPTHAPTYFDYNPRTAENEDGSIELCMDKGKLEGCHAASRNENHPIQGMNNASD